MKRKALLAAVALLAIGFTGCNKRCQCYDRNGAMVYYTQDEVKAAGRSCSEMTSQAGKDYYYYLCEWEIL